MAKQVPSSSTGCHYFDRPEEILTNAMCLDEIVLYENLEYALMNVTEYYKMNWVMKNGCDESS